MDHTHYARWLSVFLQTFNDLEAFHPDVYAEFMNGRFVVQKSKKKFESLLHDENENSIKTSTSKLKLTSLKQDCQLFSRLYVVCQSRESDFSEFFAHVN